MPALGQYVHRVSVEAPSTAPPDPDGGWAGGWAPLTPADWDCEIRQATQRDLETLGGQTTLAQATHVVRGHFHPGITTKARLLFGGRILNVIYVSNRDEANRETDLICSEVVE